MLRWNLGPQKVTTMTSKGRLYGCPVELTLDLLGGKWKTIILCRLKEKSMRYGELRRAVPELTDKVLTQRLHELEDAGFIERQMEDGLPRYGISERGRSLAPALEALNTWGEVQGALLGARFRTVRSEEADGKAVLENRKSSPLRR